MDCSLRDIMACYLTCIKIQKRYKSERNSHSKDRGGVMTELTVRYLHCILRERIESRVSRRLLSYQN